MIDQVAASLRTVQTRSGHLLNLIVLTGDAAERQLSVKLIEDPDGVALQFTPEEGRAFELMKKYAERVLTADGFNYNPDTYTVKKKREVSDAVTQKTNSDGNEVRKHHRNSGKPDSR
jgi:hypothetical protein